MIVASTLVARKVNGLPENHLRFRIQTSMIAVHAVALIFDIALIDLHNRHANVAAVALVLARIAHVKTENTAGDKKPP